MTHARPPLSLLSLALTASLLSACSSSPTPPRASQATVPPVLQPVSLVTVPLQAGDSPSSVGAALHGTVLSWNDAGCASGVTVDCEAIVGGQDPVALAAQGVGRLGRPVTVEANGAAFRATGTLLVGMEGARIAWAGGSLQAWTQGARIAWAGGTYAPVPQNTATWTQVHLQQAQALADRTLADDLLHRGAHRLVQVLADQVLAVGPLGGVGPALGEQQVQRVQPVAHQRRQLLLAFAQVAQHLGAPAHGRFQGIDALPLLAVLRTWAVVAVREPPAPIKPAALSRSPVARVMAPWALSPPAPLA